MGRIISNVKPEDSTLNLVATNLAFFGLPFTVVGNVGFLLTAIDQVIELEDGGLQISLRGGMDVILSPEDRTIFNKNLAENIRVAQRAQTQQQFAIPQSIAIKPV